MQILVMKDGFIWHQTKVRSIKKSRQEKKNNCFECLHLVHVNIKSGKLAQFYWKSLFTMTVEIFGHSLANFHCQYAENTQFYNLRDVDVTSESRQFDI